MASGVKEMILHCGENKKSQESVTKSRPYVRTYGHNGRSQGPQRPVRYGEEKHTQTHTWDLRDAAWTSNLWFRGGGGGRGMQGQLEETEIYETLARSAPSTQH